MPLCVLLETPVGGQTHVTLVPLPDDWRLEAACTLLATDTVASEVVTKALEARAHHMALTPQPGVMGRARWLLVYRNDDGTLEPIMPLDMEKPHDTP